MTVKNERLVAFIDPEIAKEIRVMAALKKSSLGQVIEELVKAHNEKEEEDNNYVYAGEY